MPESAGDEADSKDDGWALRFLRHGVRHRVNHPSAELQEASEAGAVRRLRRKLRRCQGDRGVLPDARGVDFSRP